MFICYNFFFTGQYGLIFLRDEISFNALLILATTIVVEQSGKRTFFVLLSIKDLFFIMDYFWGSIPSASFAVMNAIDLVFGLLNLKFALLLNKVQFVIDQV